jgi:XTP/dITP diphosphohydrolase
VLVGLETAVENAPPYLTVSGTAEGRIAHQAAGKEGFGYDPYFLTDDVPGKSFAELSISQKNAISHRGRALRALTQLI